MECQICTTEFRNEDPEEKLCSSNCSQVSELMGDVCAIIKGTSPSDDPRIFFFPLSFGQLLDHYVVTSLRRSATHSVARQQRMDYDLLRLKKSITTHIGQIAFIKSMRDGINVLVHRLFEINARIWNANDLARRETIPLDERQKMFFNTVSYSGIRVKTIRQLDILMTGKTTEVRIYCGKDY
mgnify:CR=1 FL=1